MTRDETRFSPNVGSLYSFVETSGWTVGATQCTFNVKGGITSNYNWDFTGYSQLQWYENGTWHNLSTEKSGYYGGYGDKVYDSRNDAFDRHSTNRTVRVGNYAHAYVNGQSTSARAYIEYTVPALPPDATTLNAVRNSDTSVTLSWATSMGYAESVKVERSVDGSAFSEIASLSNLASGYTDSTTSADHTYTYRWRYYNKNAYGAYSPTASVTMAPSAPSAISLERSDATNVNVTLTNTSIVSTSVEWQASYDGGATWGASSTVEGSPVTSFVANTSGGTVIIRVRNVNETGSSAWLTSGSIVTITPPAAPTLVSPTGVFNMSAGSVTFTWLHNPKDGSAQTAAQLAYSTNGGSSWTTVNKTTQQSHTISPIPWAAGTTITWRVRTKGADPSYGDWASSKQFICYQVPSLAFASGNPPSSVSSMPIPIRVVYSDPQGMACAAANVAIQKDGRTVYSEQLEIIGNTLSGQIDAAEMLPENGATYSVTVTARSGSSLQATATADFTVDFIAPTPGTLDIQNDPDTGYVSLLASFDNHASDVEYSGTTPANISVDANALRSFSVIGLSEQGNTPTPSAPSLIRSVGLVDIGFIYGTSLRTDIEIINGTRIYSLPDGTVDILSMDSDGNAAIRRRVAAVDMSTLSWGKGENVYYAALPNGRRGDRDEFLLCDSYQCRAAVSNLSSAEANLENNRICTSYNTSTSMIYLRNDAITTVSDLAESLSGVIVLYPLATEQTETVGQFSIPTFEGLTNISIDAAGARGGAAAMGATYELITKDGPADAESVSVIRINRDGTRTQLIDRGEADTGYIDKYAPLNTDYSYEVITYAQSGTYAVNTVANKLETTRWFAYWGDNLAWARWNPSGSYSITRPEKKRVHYAGRKWPVSYDSKAIDQEHSMSWLAVDMDEWSNGFVDLMNDGGRGVYKGCDGWVFHADFELNATPEYTSITRMGAVSLTVTRIDGEQL